MSVRGDNLDRLVLLSGSSNLPLAERVAEYHKKPLATAEIRRFSDGEVFVEIQENVRGRDVFVIQSTSTPANDHLMELLILIDALRRASAERITAVLPYYGYARQDRKVSPRTPITAKLVADLLVAAGTHRVLTMDLHAGQIQGFFNIPVDNLYATPVLLPYMKEHYGGNGEDLVIVSPDAGGVERARAFAKRLNADLAVCDKRRPAPNQAEIMRIVGDVRGKTALLVDDMIDTGGTIIRAAEALLDAGALSVSAFATHAVLSGNAVERLGDSPLREVVVTDTIDARKKIAGNPKFKVLSVGELLGEAILRIYQETSVSSLFV